jgi:hypothetical protein
MFWRHVRASKQNVLFTCLLHIPPILALSIFPPQYYVLLSVIRDMSIDIWNCNSYNLIFRGAQRLRIVWNKGTKASKESALSHSQGVSIMYNYGTYSVRVTHSHSTRLPHPSSECTLVGSVLAVLNRTHSKLQGVYGLDHAISTVGRDQL